MDYKDTLNLPKTTFPMKANLTAKEPRFSPSGKNGDIPPYPRGLPGAANLHPP
jgi:hypothetical protein